MPCQTCDHTMQNLGVELPEDGPVNAVFWCPRCGTIKSRRRSSSTEEFVSVSVPFWTQRAPNVQLCRANNLLHEIGDVEDSQTARYLREAIERETARLVRQRDDLLAACQQSLRLLNLRLALADICDDEKSHIDALRVAIAKAKGA